MAAAGLLSNPPQTARQQTRARFLAKKKSGGKAPKQKGGYPNLSPAQNQIIAQREQGDIGLGTTAQTQMPAIAESYAQPFDWQALPEAPVTGDYQGWVNEQMGNYNEAFDARMAPEFQKQTAEFEQQMANRGIPMGSELYNKEKTRMEQAQNDARTQAYASGQGQAIQGAQSLFGVGTQARDDAYRYAQAQRNMPLDTYNALMASRGQYENQNLAYEQQRAMQEDQQKQEQWMLKHTPRGGGGGGGGGGGIGPFKGFSSMQEMWAAEDARNRSNQQWSFENDPRYRQDSGPSTAAQIGGGLLKPVGSIIGDVAGGWFKKKLGL